MITIVVVSLLIFIFMGVPICFSIMLSGFLAVALTDAFPLYMTVQRFIGGINSFSLMAIPFFIMAGQIMSVGGISRRIVGFCSAIFSWLRGGLSIVCVGANMIFAGISGSGVANISAIGSLTAPSMIERGYGRGYVGALVAASGSIGPIIPPSCEMIVFASITGFSVSRMFMGAVLPGLGLGLMFMITCYLYAKAKNIDYGGKFSLRATWIAFKDAVWALIMPLIIVGGVVTGTFTATESGAIACVYGVIVGLFVYKELHIKDLISCFFNSTKSTAQCMMILGASTLYAYIFTVENMGEVLQNFLLGITGSTLGIMVITAGLMIFIGMFMETLAVMPVVLPIVFPLLQSMGANMTQFGIMFCLCTILGGLTPPVGVYLFVSSSVVKAKAQAIIPWMMVMIAISLINIVIVTLWPAYSSFIPSLLFD